MKKTSLLLVLIFLFNACRLVPAGGRPALAGEIVSGCRANVDGLAGLINGLDIPAYFLAENPAKQGGEFEVGKYFGVLDHLSMQPGFTLDYVYHYDGMGGYPRLYARPVDQAPFATEAELDAGGDKPSYLDFIQSDGTPEGFFQYVLLAIMGNHFYLNWHANYNDSMLVCDKAEVMAVVAMTDHISGIPMPLKGRVQARFLQYVEPRFLAGEETVEVQIVTFTQWGGFYRETYTLQRSFPHTILDIQQENLVPYDCGVMF
jgi:hypothetical protein